MTAENRLDVLVDSLRQVEPALDDLTRARVGVELQASLRGSRRADENPGARTRPTRVLLGVGAAGLAAAAALAIALGTGALSFRTGARGTGARRSDDPASAMSPAGASAASARPLAPGAAVDVVPGSAERVAIGGAEVTVYGPGRVSSRGLSPDALDPRGAGASIVDVAANAVVDADAALVDRSQGDGTLALTYGDLEVRVTRATFALDRTVAPRVTVMRGELLLRCASGERPVRAGESATCAPATPSSATPAQVTTLAETVPPSETPPGPRAPGRIDSARRDVDAVSPPRFAPTAIDEYAEADAAMRRGDRPAARVALEALVAAHPAGADAAAALLDLARLDAATDPDAARRRLDALDAHPHGAVLAEPAMHLRCTLVAASDRAGRIACLASYYRRFPDSPRAAAVLARLAVLHAAADCAAAAPLLAEYLARFPDGPDRTAVLAWRDRCAAP